MTDEKREQLRNFLTRLEEGHLGGYRADGKFVIADEYERDIRTLIFLVDSQPSEFHIGRRKHHIDRLESFIKSLTNNNPPASVMEDFYYICRALK